MSPKTRGTCNDRSGLVKDGLPEPDVPPDFESETAEMTGSIAGVLKKGMSHEVSLDSGASGKDPKEGPCYGPEEGYTVEGELEISFGGG